MARIIVVVLIGYLGGLASMQDSKNVQEKEDRPLRLGNFSVSLVVKDLSASRAFYQKLGFQPFGNFASKSMVILQNETATIGLFQAGLDKNAMTFNPGWDRSAKTLSEFDDVRDIQKVLKSRGIALTTEADQVSTGPAFVTLVDPDGNQILIDQHVPRPKK